MVRRAQRDHYRFDILRDGPVNQNLGSEQNTVIVRTTNKLVDTIRLDLNRAEVGNGDPAAGLVLPGQGSGLAVRVQAQDAGGAAFGPASRFDDEGITFRTQSRDVMLDIRDVGGGSIGLFDVAVLGTTTSDTFDFSRQYENYYVHGGVGNDIVVGGSGADYVIGGFGNDLVRGNGGNDVVVGGPGTDRLEGGAGNDTAVYRLGLDGDDSVDLGAGADTVSVLGAPGEVRLTLSTLQIGNGSVNDSGALPSEDGGLNVRFQAEDSAGNLTGAISRYDDEGISFIGAPGVTFEIRNLSDGAVRGTGYGIARFGSSGDDVYDDSAATVNVFQNGGMGNDRLTGGSGADHLVGLDGNDRLEGGGGNDLLVGLAGSDTFVFAGVPGNDTIMTYQAGVDRIDFSAYDITIDDVQATQTGPNTLIKVDSDGNGEFDFEIFVGGSAPPLPADYIF
jgi:Ca2+-binding RTX toxin-like protein